MVAHGLIERLAAQSRPGRVTAAAHTLCVFVEDDFRNGM
jgi:hypothetical protein